MKPTNALIGSILMTLPVWIGCESANFSLGRSNQPVSTPLADANVAPPSEPVPQSQPAATQPGNDSEFLEIEKRFQQYAAQFPATDLDRKIDGPPPAASTQPAAPIEPKAPVAIGHAEKRVPDNEPPRPASPPPATIVQPAPAAPAMRAVDIRDSDAQDASAAAPASQEAPQVAVLNVRPVVEPSVPASQPAAQANQPVTPTDDDDGRENVTGLIKRLEERLAKRPQQLDDQFKLRLLYLATDQPDKAKQPCKDLDPVQGEMLSALVETMSAAQQALRDPAGAASSALSAVGELQRVLSEQSPVVIAKMALVTSVRSFGDYREVKPARFPAGQPMHVFCYTELANFRSEPTPDGRLRTLLSGKIEIFNEAGKIIWEHEFPQIEDRVLSPRRDFFVPLEIKMDAGQPAGTYILKVTVEDQLGATTDQQRLTFTVGN